MCKYLNIFLFSLLLVSCSYEQPVYDPQRKEDNVSSDPITEVDWKIDGTEASVPSGNDINEEILKNKGYKLVWMDDFDDTDLTLDNDWEADNLDYNNTDYQLCSRWRRNVVEGEGVLRIYNKKEKVATSIKEWTSGSIWTRKHFKYGYFECRYKYAGALATNNSFWLMTRGVSGDQVELDANEGGFPSKYSTSAVHHNVTPKAKYPLAFTFAKDFAYSFPLPKTILAQKVRFSTNFYKQLHMREFRIYGYNEKGYPKPDSPTADSDVSELVNYALGATITCSGVLNSNYKIENLIDGNFNTEWTSQISGQKWIEIDLNGLKPIRCIQFTNGWYNEDVLTDVPNDYKIEAFDGNEWITIRDIDITRDDHPCNMATHYNVVGFEWTPEELVYYMNGKEMRRIKNPIPDNFQRVHLSCCIMDMGEPVTPELDGSFMEVDYVKIYQKEGQEMK